MSTFNLPNWTPEVPVSLPNELSKDQVLSFPAFKTWISTLQRSLKTQENKDHPFHSAPYALKKIEVQTVDFFGGDRIGFLKLKAQVENENGERIPGSVFLRGGSVGMLLVLQPDDVPEGSEEDKHVILTIQPRIPAGSLSMVEIPAGMLDDSGTFTGAAAKEIHEECGLEIPEDELINMTEFTLPETTSSDAAEALQRAVYPSPGGSDEFIPLFLWQKRVKRDSLKEWQGKLTGERDKGEKITLKLCRLQELWKEAGRDAKSLAAWALYEGLRREGKV